MLGACVVTGGGGCWGGAWSQGEVVTGVWGDSVGWVLGVWEQWFEMVLGLGLAVGRWVLEMEGDGGEVLTGGGGTVGGGYQGWENSGYQGEVVAGEDFILWLSPF